MIKFKDLSMCCKHEPPQGCSSFNRLMTQRGGASWTKDFTFNFQAVSSLKKALDLDDVTKRRDAPSTPSSTLLNANDMTIFPPLIQLIVIIGAALTIAEILNISGFFHDANGRKAKRKTRQYLDSLHNNTNDDDADSSTFSRVLENIPILFGNWFHHEFNERGGLFHFPSILQRIENTLNSIFGNILNGDVELLLFTPTSIINMEKLPYKHQFAIGSVIGMITAYGRNPMIITKAIGFIYIFSEMLHQLVVSRYSRTFEQQNQQQPRRERNNGEAYEYLRAFLEETNIGNGDSSAFFDKIDHLESKLVKALRFCNQRLNWMRVKIRVFIQSPLQTWDKLLDSNGTIVSGIVLGIVLGALKVV